jgi:hypothetical protein
MHSVELPLELNPARMLICVPDMSLISTSGLPAWVRILTLPSANFRLVRKLLGRVRSGLLVVLTFRIAYIFLCSFFLDL